MLNNNTQPDIVLEGKMTFGRLTSEETKIVRVKITGNNIQTFVEIKDDAQRPHWTSASDIFPGKILRGVLSGEIKVVEPEQPAAAAAPAPAPAREA